MQSLNKKRPGIVYSHPWEIDTEQPVLKVSPLIKFVHYYNLNTTINKLEKVLNRFAFAPLGTVIKEREYPEMPL
jgi:hypothetical protein